MECEESWMDSLGVPQDSSGMMEPTCRPIRVEDVVVKILQGLEGFLIGLSVLGVGGIEAEATLIGQHVRVDSGLSTVDTIQARG